VLVYDPSYVSAFLFFNIYTRSLTHIFLAHITVVENINLVPEWYKLHTIKIGGDLVVLSDRTARLSRLPECTDRWQTLESSRVRRSLVFSSEIFRSAHITPTIFNSDNLVKLVILGWGFDRSVTTHGRNSTVRCCSGPNILVINIAISITKCSRILEISVSEKAENLSFDLWWILNAGFFFGCDVWLNTWS
jgi:hypothetical protein